MHFWRLLVWAIGADVPRNLDEITCPVMLAQGSVDFVAAGQTARFLTCVTNARFSILPFAGHAAQADVPERVAELVHDTAAGSLTNALQQKARRVRQACTSRRPRRAPDR